MSLKVQNANEVFGLTFHELGLLTYMLDNVDAKGLFQQHIDDIALAGNVSHGTAHGLQQSLIAKGYAVVVEPPRRGKRGRYSTAAILRPGRARANASVSNPQIDSVEVVEKIEKSPSQPLYTTESILTGYVVDSSSIEISAVDEQKTISSKNIEHSTSVGVEIDSVKSDSVPALQPYGHGASVPVDQFDQRKIPFCLYCDEQKVGTMRVPRTPEEPAHVSLDTYCSDDCEEAHRVEKRQAKEEAHDRMVASWKASGESAR